MAAGSYIDATNTTLPFAERWDGTSWSVEPTVAVSGAMFRGVSCESASYCLAVGVTVSSGGQETPFAETWNGTSWVVRPPPEPVGGTFPELSAVSCRVAVTWCVAVGSYDSSSASGDVPLAEIWTGQAWYVDFPPFPPPPARTEEESGLAGVSCPTVSACVAVGSAAGNPPLIERFDGISWSIQSDPAPVDVASGNNAPLQGVSCRAADACNVVGGYPAATAEEATLAEGWNGSMWSLEQTQNPGFRGSYEENLLAGVSCGAAAVCEAVGLDNTSSDETAPLAEEWNGTDWSVQSIPVLSGNEPAVSGCDTAGDEVLVAPANPSLSIQASAGVPVGGNVQAAATLTGGDAPGGQITFSLYGPSCETLYFTRTVTVTGNGR